MRVRLSWSHCSAVEWSSKDESVLLLHWTLSTTRHSKELRGSQSCCSVGQQTWLLYHYSEDWTSQEVTRMTTYCHSS